MKEINITEEDIEDFIITKKDSAYAIAELYTYKWLKMKYNRVIHEGKVFDFYLPKILLSKEGKDIVVEVKYNHISLSPEQVRELKKLLTRGDTIFYLITNRESNKLRKVDSFKTPMGTFYCYELGLDDLKGYSMVNNNWDKGIDFEKARRLLLRKLKEEGKKEGVRKISRMAHYITALIQLCNGSRASEAVDAFNKWRETGKREVEVRVRKKRYGDYRLVVIPSEVMKYRNTIRYYNQSTSKYKNFIRQNFDFNTHSLRYAFVTHLAGKGVSPQLIAKITHHEKIDMILNYTQQKRADELLRELIK